MQKKFSTNLSFFLDLYKYLRINFLWAISIILHLLTWLIVELNGQFLLNDSVIYLTMAKNIQDYGIISQSFYEPILPDFQRSPLYPIFLAFLPISLVLLFQHILILLSGYFIQRLAIFLCSQSYYFRFLGVIFTLMPYSINLPSFILSETVFVFFLTLTLIFLILFLDKSRLNYLIYHALTLILCCYTRASILPFIFWIVLCIYLFSRSISKTLCFIGIISVGLFPWIYRNYSYTGSWFFTTATQITTFYGRIGGTVLAFNKNMNQDAYLKVYAEEFINTHYSLYTFKKYPQNQVNEENEFIQLPLLWIYFKQHFQMPLHALFFHLRCFYQQMSGLSYGMSQYLFQNDGIAMIMAGIQGFFIILVYGLFFFVGYKAKNKRLWIMWLLGMILWLLIHNAAWADGRYRYVTDLWCILGIIVVGRE